MKLIDGVNHMGIVSDPGAVSIIADDVATSRFELMTGIGCANAEEIR